jgi:putative transposase
MARRYELNDQQWARIAEMLPGKQSDPGRTAKDNASSWIVIPAPD